MKLESTSNPLSFVDGQAKVATSYSLDGISVEAYQ
jgi:hypothetical protein